MKILQLCKKFPYPMKDGESIAVNQLSEGLHSLGCQVTLLAMNTSKHLFNLDELPSDYEHYEAIHAVEVDNKVRFWGAFLNLFSKKSYHIERFNHLVFSKQLASILQNNSFDIIQLETIYLAPYLPIIRQFSKAKVVLRSHNVEHEIWERLAQHEANWLKKKYIAHLAAKLKAFELTHLNAFDLLICISKRDLLQFKNLGYRGDAIICPVGVQQQVVKSYPTHCSRLGFIGSLDWQPNQQGLMWFMDNVWESLIERFPTLFLQIAGRNTPAKILNHSWKQVEVLGEISDATQFMLNQDVLICPLLAGSGMRVKIVEAMSLGRVVITTSMGLEGIAAKHKLEVLIADTPAEFIACVTFLRNNPSKLKEIGARAKQFINYYLQADTIVSTVFEKYKLLLSNHNSKVKKDTPKVVSLKMP